MDQKLYPLLHHYYELNGVVWLIFLNLVTLWRAEKDGRDYIISISHRITGLQGRLLFPLKQEFQQLFQLFFKSLNPCILEKYIDHKFC